MKNEDNLEQLLTQLGCKTPLGDIPATEHQALTAFLKREKQLRHSLRLQRLLATCGIHKNQIRTFEQFDWDFNPLTPKEDILAFRNSPWVSKPANLVLIGDAGIGKSHFAKAFCYDAISQGHKAYFINAFDLVSKIKKAPYPLNKIDYYGRTLKVRVLPVSVRRPKILRNSSSGLGAGPVKEGVQADVPLAAASAAMVI